MLALCLGQLKTTSLCRYLGNAIAVQLLRNLGGGDPPSGKLEYSHQGAKACSFSDIILIQPSSPPVEVIRVIRVVSTSLDQMMTDAPLVPRDQTSPNRLAMFTPFSLYLSGRSLLIQMAASGHCPRDRGRRSSVDLRFMFRGCLQ